MKYALFDKASGIVRQWQDHALFGYAEVSADELLALPEDFEFPEGPCHVLDGKLVDGLPPAAPVALPTKEQRIAALLATHGETRLTIQAALVSLETAAAVQKIPLDALYARNKTYKVCKDIETACQAIEKA